jgi:predicted double-glycine peptidase
MSTYDAEPTGLELADCEDQCAQDAPLVEVVEAEYSEPVFEQPAYEEPLDPEPEYAELEYAEPEYAEPEYAEPEYAEPEYVDPVVEQPAYEQPEYETPDAVAPAAAWEPTVYEDGTLISQVPVAEDLATVEEITQTEVYRSWEAASGGFQPAAGPEGSLVTGSLTASPGLIGDTGDVNFWFQQNSQFSCGPSSVAQIVSDFTGVLHSDESAIAARAQQLGWYEPSSGMLPQNVANLLDDQGVESTMHRDQSFDDVEQYLREGRAVVMFLDSRDVMPATGYEAYVAADELENSAQDTVDHFVRVIGIDRAAGVAIIANPGYAGASQVEIPLDQLEDAWNDNVIRSDTQIDRARILIVSDGSDPTPDDVQLPVAQPVTPQPVAPQPMAPQPATPEPTFGQPIAPEPAPVPSASGAEPGPAVDPAVQVPEAPAPASPSEVRLPEPVDAPLLSAPPAREVELPAPRTSSVVVPAPPAAPSVSPVLSEVRLPAADSELPVPEAAADTAEEERSLFQAVPGWVLIPVTLAAGRIGAALRSKA